MRCGDVPYIIPPPALELPPNVTSVYADTAEVCRVTVSLPRNSPSALRECDMQSRLA